MGGIVFVGAYAYAQRVLDAMPRVDTVITTWRSGPRWERLHHATATFIDNPIPSAFPDDPELVVVAGWRSLVPIKGPTIGFHSAKLPEYPGRAPVPNAILRGDKTLTNTMLWLDDGIDTGDIIDEWEFPIVGLSPDDIYGEVGETSALMLEHWWDDLLAGTAPRRKQDMSKRGPLTPADAWQRLEAR